MTAKPWLVQLLLLDFAHGVAGEFVDDADFARPLVDGQQPGDMVDQGGRIAGVTDDHRYHSFTEVARLARR